MSILPSFPAPNFQSLEHALETLRGVSTAFQVDVVAAEFAGTASWPETEPHPLAELLQLEQWTDVYQLEVDLMVSHPAKYFAPVAKLGSKRVVAHVTQKSDVGALVNEAKMCQLELSFALTAEIPFELVVPFIKSGEVTSVQLMGIAQVGKQGQPFDERVLPRIRELRTLYPELGITIDGAVNEETLPLLFAAGADRFAPGSAVVKATDPVAAYKHLQRLLAE